MRKFKEKKILVSLYNLFTDLLFEQIFIFMPDRLKYVCVGTTQEIKHYLDKWNLNFSRAEIIVRLLSKTESSDQDQHLCWLKLIVLFSLVSTPSSDSSSSKYRLQLKYDHGMVERSTVDPPCTWLIVQVYLPWLCYYFCSAMERCLHWTPLMVRPPSLALLAPLVMLRWSSSLTPPV